jgi:hypothetical protein
MILDRDKQWVVMNTVIKIPDSIKGREFVE